MAGKKIGELTPLGRNLIATDELELSLAGSAGSRKITGAEIIGAAGGVSSVTGTSPIVSSGGSTPAISIATANTTTTGALTSTDWNAFNGKQNSITLTTTGSNGSSTFISNTLNVPTYTLGGLGGVPYTGATQNVNLGAYNLSANNLFDGFSSIVASGTLVTLTINSVPSYVVTGSGGQVIKLPDATTLPNGAAYFFNNNQSSGAISVNNNSNTLVASIPSGGFSQITLLSNSTAAGSWERHEQAPSNVTWSTNTFDYAGSITSATWNGVAIADNRISSSAVWNAKQDALVSGTNIKTINSNSLLGSGNVAVQPTLVSGTNIKTINSNSLLGSGDLVIGGLPAWVETNATDLTIWNNGKGNIATNTSFGDGALKVNTTGENNTAIGNNALAANTTGSFNTAVGVNALTSSTTTGSSTAVGYNALRLNTTGFQNTAVGGQALSACTSGFQNTSMGAFALGANTTGYQNTAFGSSAGQVITTGNSNAVFGSNALDACTTGADNTAIGANALGALTTASNNVAVGSSALGANTTGTQNVAIGHQASLSATTAINNVAIGYQAQYQSTTGGSNTSVGFQANGGITTGSSNTGIGTGANQNVATGVGNTGVGQQAGGAASGTQYSVAIGFQTIAGSDAVVIGTSSNSSTFTGGVIIGRSAAPTANNQFVVGSASYNAGAITTETLTSTKTWSVIINGTAYKILLA